MADISSYLAKILEAVYGEEVRGSIHDALAAMNVESNQAMYDAALAKDSAKASAEEAKQSEENAKTSEDNAKAFEISAANSETNVMSAETRISVLEANARAHAANAATSEQNAANSEAIATQKAEEADASKTSAALSESNTLAAEERVKTVRDEVEVLGAQAAQNKDEAESAKDAAEASKTAAALSEGNAAQSASAAAIAKDDAENAQGKAEEAQQAAEAAKDASETAQKAAESAQAEAKASEENAASSAESAKQYSGNPAQPIDGSWWIWNAETGEYEDTGITCEQVGPTGNGIESITLTSGDHSPGSTDIYTIKMTDGTQITMPVYHGKNGTGVGDIVGVAFDLTIPVDGWNDLECIVEDSRLLASAKYKYMLDAYSTSKTEMMECDVMADDITTDGSIKFTASITPIRSIIVNVVRLELGANTEQGGMDA